MIHEIKKGGTPQGQEAYANHRIIDGVSKVDIDGNNTLYIKAIAATVSTCET
jgi:hypothetical protein